MKIIKSIWIRSDLVELNWIEFNDFDAVPYRQFNTSTINLSRNIPQIRTECAAKHSKWATGITFCQGSVACLCRSRCGLTQLTSPPLHLIRKTRVLVTFQWQHRVDIPWDRKRSGHTLCRQRTLIITKSSEEYMIMIPEEWQSQVRQKL